MNTNEEIFNWLNKQNEWVREAAHRLLTKGDLDDKDIGDLVALAKKTEPKEKASQSYPSINKGTAATAELRLESIGPVVGIDALNPKKPLTFGEGKLSVVYGTNGSGKSGFTRIITKACGKAHSVLLKPNVYDSQPTKQECTFDYSLGGERKQTVWIANSDPVEDLKPIDVFDTECGRLYLEKDTQLSYEPSELSLFTDLVSACKRVDAALTTEQLKLSSKLPEIPAQHAGTEAGRSYAALTKDTAPAKITELVTWTTLDEATLNEQRERVKIADPAGAAKKKREAKVQIVAIHAALQRGVDALSTKTLDAVRQLKNDAGTKRRTAQEGARLLGSAAMLDGVGTMTWKAMWEAARSYSKAQVYPQQDFPYTGDAARCVLCQQNLDDEAQRRLEGFEAFVRGTLEKDATDAESSLKENLKLVPARPAPDVVTTVCQAAGLPENVQAAVEAAWSKLEPLLAPLREGTVPLLPPIVEQNVLSLLSLLQDLGTAAEDSAKELDADAKSPDRTQGLARVAELEGKKWVTEQASAVLAEVDRLKKSAEYDDWKRKTLTTGISRKAGELSEVLITEAYVQRFNNELKQLGAHKVQVELVKTATNYGRIKHGIRLRDAADESVRVSDVLSEGERRIVALAAFIADVTGREIKAPFVFDDPISSLDQIFEERVITRLIDLSRERQVLIFTHRLSFLGIIDDLARGELHDVHIRREPWGTGQPGEVPIFGKKTDKALNNLKSDRVAKARKAWENDGYDSYYPLAKAICSDFRILLERIVETVFLADVVQRHRRAVNTMGKIGNLAKIKAADCDLIDELMTKYSCYEHSQSDEAPVDVPEPKDIEADIDRMVEWHREFTARPV